MRARPWIYWYASIDPVVTPSSPIYYSPYIFASWCWIYPAFSLGWRLGEQYSFGTGFVFCISSQARDPQPNVHVQMRLLVHYL
ncbi:hypothetical protein BDV28DRAFT_144084, partial [Aspergillus coremiiformis]